MKVKTLKRFTAIALSLICIVLSLPLYTSAVDGDTAGSAAATLSAADVPALLDFAEAAANGHIRRLYEEETDLYTAVFENADGSKTVYTFGEPIKYVAQSGEIRDKKTTLASSENGFTAADNDVVVSVPGSVSGAAAITRGGNTVTITPKDRAGITAPAVLMSDNTVRFSEPLFAANSLSYTALPSGISSDITLNRYDGEYIFAFDIGVGALTVAASENGIYSVTDANGTPLFNFGDVVFTDSAGNYSFAELEFEPDGDGHYSLKVIADPDFLQSEDTVYPLAASVTASVAITRTISGSNTFTVSKTIYQNPPSTVNDRYMIIGDSGDADSSNKSFVDLKIPGLYEHNLFINTSSLDISSVMLYLYCTNNRSGRVTATQFKGISGYTTANEQYDTVIENSSVPGASAQMCTVGRYNSVNITGMAQHWRANMDDSNSPKKVMMYTSTTAGHIITYASSKTSVSGQMPYISFTRRVWAENKYIATEQAHRIVNANNGKAITYNNNTFSLTDDNSNASQTITPIYYESSEQNGYLLKLPGNKYLSINSSGGFTAETIISHPSPYSLWLFDPAPQSTAYRIIPRTNTAKCLTASGSSLTLSDNDTNVTIAGNNTSAKQKAWYLKPIHIWYSQFDAAGNWNAELLPQVYFGNLGNHFMRGTGEANTTAIMDKGCVITSIAMVLRNLGATMQGYDIRNPGAGMHKMQADPFTVTLANCSLLGNEYTVSNTTPQKYTFAYNGNSIPVDTDWSKSVGAFGYGFNLQKRNGASAQTYRNRIINTLSQHPEGIIVYFKKDSRTHGVVFTGYDAENNDFIVCDPGTRDRAKGNNISLTQFSQYQSLWFADIDYFVSLYKNS